MSKAKKAMVAMLAVMCSLISCIAVFAESSGTANTAVTSAMQTVANDMVATGNAVIPIALTVIGISMVVMFGIRMFTRVTGTRR